MGQRFVDIEKLDIRPVFVVVIDGLDTGVGTVENRTSETTGYKDRVFSICDIGQRPFFPTRRENRKIRWNSFTLFDFRAIEERTHAGIKPLAAKAA